jgi:hypothetical protein
MYLPPRDYVVLKPASIPLPPASSTLAHQNNKHRTSTTRDTDNYRNATSFQLAREYAS